ncbi:hypothetical protein [Aliikangiella sp. IMCC44359]|uniref:hypothetical protein n=1 Tax=Aliikangiella sp. IMCC44359 TaxID=3459125 RepID=UPI00403ACFB6
MSEKTELEDELLPNPRERHYAMAHIALRQISQRDPHYFFGILTSEESRDFLAHVIQQVEQNYPQDPTLLAPEEFAIVPMNIGKHPLILLSMPEAKVYTECIYIGIVSILDMFAPQDTPNPKVRYFTLELGQGDAQDCAFFSEWQDNTHISLGEVDRNCTLNEFAMLINQRFEMVE